MPTPSAADRLAALERAVAELHSRVLFVMHAITRDEPQPLIRGFRQRAVRISLFESYQRARQRAIEAAHAATPPPSPTPEDRAEAHDETSLDTGVGSPAPDPTA